MRLGFLAAVLSLGLLFACGDDGASGGSGGTAGEGGAGGAGGIASEPLAVAITIKPELPCVEGEPSFYNVSAEVTSNSGPALVVAALSDGPPMILSETPTRLLMQNESDSYPYFYVLGEAVVDTFATIGAISSVQISGALETCESFVLE